jgi:hypothetical protein
MQHNMQHARCVPIRLQGKRKRDFMLALLCNAHFVHLLVSPSLVDDDIGSVPLPRPTPTRTHAHPRAPPSKAAVATRSVGRSVGFT